MKIKKILLLMMFTIILASCGNNVNGTYEPSNKGFLGSLTSRSSVFEKLIFSSDNKVQAITHNGIFEGTYVIEESKVKITFERDGSSEDFAFIIDDKGCIDGGSNVGKYCKK